MFPSIETLSDPKLVYFFVFFLMTIESSFIPFPSEVVMIPAGYLTAKGIISIPMAIFFGTLGSLAGAMVNYYLAYFIGKPLFTKYGKYIFMPEERFEKVEQFFKKYGNFSTFIGRFVPWIRQVISLPAGLFKMPFLPFIFYTCLGAGIWVTVLTYLGYSISKAEDAFYYSSVIGKSIAIAVVIALLVIVVFPKFIYKKSGKKDQTID